MVINLQLWASVPYMQTYRALYLSEWLTVDYEKPNISLFFFILLEDGPPTPSAFMHTIIMAPLLMSLELSLCNDWKLEPLLSLIGLLNGELEELCM